MRRWDTATGGLQEISKSDATLDELEFSHDGSYLITDLGTPKIQSGHENQASNSIYESPAIFIERGQWINLNRKYLLWLPPEFPPSCSAIAGGSFSLGHSSGQVSFIQFRV